MVATKTTSFTYGGAPLLGLAKLASISDRRGTSTSFTYSSSPDTTTVDQAGQRRLFKSIDDSGRVGEINEGATSNSFLHQTLRTFDKPGATCRRPDAVVDNNLCRQVKKSLSLPDAAYLEPVQ